MTIKFVICERLHEGGAAIPNVLVRYEAESFCFADGNPDCFDPDQILKFDSWESAETIVNLAWDLNQTYLGIALWDSDYPNEIDYMYVGSGKAKNLQVIQNRMESKKDLIWIV